MFVCCFVEEGICCFAGALFCVVFFLRAFEGEVYTAFSMFIFVHHIMQGEAASDEKVFACYRGGCCTAAACTAAPHFISCADDMHGGGFYSVSCVCDV